MNLLADRAKNLELSEIRKMYLQANEKTLDLGLGQLLFQAPIALINAGQKAFQAALSYTPNAGIDELRAAIAEELNNTNSLELNKDNTLVTNGVQEGIFITMASLLNPGDEVLIPEIYFSVYTTIADIFGAKPVYYSLDENFDIDLKDLASKVSDQTKLLVINSPSNPTGCVQSDFTLQQIATIAENNELLILSDEIYQQLYYTKEKPSSILAFTDRAIVLNGLSKRSAAAGLRLGWIASKKEYIEAITPMHQYAVTSASIVAQKAAIPVVQGFAQEEEQQYRQQLIQQRDWVISELKPWIIGQPKGAFYILIQCQHLGNSKDVAQYLLQKINVLTIPGIAFGKAADGYLRLSFAGDFTIIKQAVLLLKKELENDSIERTL